MAQEIRGIRIFIAMKTQEHSVLKGLKTWLRKGFGVETFVYYTQQPMAALKAAIQDVLDASGSFSLSLKLSGTFLSDHEFELSATRNIFFVLTKPDMHERQLAYVYGKLFTDDQNRTAVWLAVRPNAPIPPALALLFPFVWLAGMLLLFHTAWKAPFSIVLCLALAGFPLLLLHIAITSYAKRRLRERVVRTFNLQPVDQPNEQ
ncbi:hypothetical protein [Taibaiella koreensis]|uniref:hypothetical protein n=1 Tax=Taibaiella koreensis TaxID=1268548 RepID=UPI000E59CC16|nr:hypothetical protein [Taibaiella koreensis]